MSSSPHLEIVTRCPKRLFIAGHWVDAASGATFDTVSPIDGTVIATVAAAGPADVDAAVKAARRALQGEWRRFKPLDRQRVLLKLADLLERQYDDFAILDCVDMGVPVSSLPQRKQRLLGLLRYYASLAVGIHGQTVENSLQGNFSTYTTKEPIGVVAAINPWNGPLHLAVWKIAPALAAGCTIVLKPAEQAPLSPLMMGQLCAEAGIPDGVVNIITGDGGVGAALASHPGVNKVSFTGSVEVGRKIVAASAGSMARLTMELGGKSPNIVLPDADLDLAVPGSAMAAFGNSGQICSAGTRLFVHRKIEEEFVARLAEYARSLKVGNPLDLDTQLGPLVSRTQHQRVTAYIEDGKNAGATDVAARGEHRSAPRSGCYVDPTVFVNVDDRMRIAREEIFGPVLVVLPFDTVEEVTSRANDSEYGLGAGVWTRDLDSAQALARGIASGSVWVNCYQMLDVAMPFGGYKLSGFGREGGSDHLEQYLNTKAVYMRHGPSPWSASP